MASTQVPIVPVVMTGAGAYLIYCAFKGLSPIGGLKNVLTGKPLGDAKLDPGNSGSGPAAPNFPNGNPDGAGQVPGGPLDIPPPGDLGNTPSANRGGSDPGVIQA